MRERELPPPRFPSTPGRPTARPTRKPCQDHPHPPGGRGWVWLGEVAPGATCFFFSLVSFSRFSFIAHNAPSPFRPPRWRVGRRGRPHCGAWSWRWRLWTWRGWEREWGRAEAGSKERETGRPELTFSSVSASVTRLTHANTPAACARPPSLSFEATRTLPLSHVRFWRRVVLRPRPRRAPVRVDLDVRRLCARRLHPAPAAVHHPEAEGLGQGGGRGRVQAVGGASGRGEAGWVGGRIGSLFFFFFFFEWRAHSRAEHARSAPTRAWALIRPARRPLAE